MDIHKRDLSLGEGGHRRGYLFVSLLESKGLLCHEHRLQMMVHVHKRGGLGAEGSYFLISGLFQTSLGYEGPYTPPLHTPKAL